MPNPNPNADRLRIADSAQIFFFIIKHHIFVLILTNLRRNELTGLPRCPTPQHIIK